MTGRCAALVVRKVHNEGVEGNALTLILSPSRGEDRALEIGGNI